MLMKILVLNNFVIFLVLFLMGCFFFFEDDLLFCFVDGGVLLDVFIEFGLDVGFFEIYL